MRQNHCFEPTSKIGVDWLTSRKTLTQGACMLFLACTPNLVQASPNNLISSNEGIDIVQQSEQATGIV